jgi:AP-4 complex subunit epsilon-1
VHKIKLSKAFHDTCVKIGECKSREEEEFIVRDWMASVKASLAKTTLRHSQRYENVVSLIHLTMLGYNTSFGHVQAVNITQDCQMQTKALGYLACAALLDSKSDLLILTINSTQRDLSSGQATPMALALTAICHLVSPDLIPAIIGYVGEALTNAVPLVRKKAVMCIHSFVQKDPTSVTAFFPELVRLLADPTYRSLTPSSTRSPSCSGTTSTSPRSASASPS